MTMEVGTLVPVNTRLLARLICNAAGAVEVPAGTVIRMGDQAGPVVATAVVPAVGADIATVAPGVYPAPGLESVMAATWPFVIVTDPTTAGVVGVLPVAGVIVTEGGVV